jgi:membrane-associated phospholipid phosphatase
VRFSKLLSYLLHPAFAPTFGMWLIMQSDNYLKQTLSPGFRIMLLLILAIYTCLLPILFVALLKWKGHLSDVEMPLRRERLLPFSFTAIFFGSAYWVIASASSPLPVLQLFGGMTAAVVLLLAATFFLKPSAHSAAWAALIAALMALHFKWGTDTGFYLPLACFLWATAATARLAENRHTHLEIILGALLGAIPVFSAIWWWN